ncbi:MAG: FAD-dependent oxidoreductase [Planctomycetes bacterium]|nr:FAD-dependent oxidoreductase [Planctomycetota bacterium]
MVFRTPLLDGLARLLRAASTSDSPAASAPTPLDRRRFLLASGGAACAAWLPASGLARPRGNARIAIVGAGLAGLSCAYRLRQRGLVAEVFEASSRFGGRCWTRRGDFAEGQLAEHGGELIDQSHTAIRQLAQELRLPLVNVLAAEANGTEACLHFLGARYELRDAARDLRSIWRAMHRDLSEASYPTTYQLSTARGRELDAQSIAQWIQSTVPGGLASPFGQLLAVAYNIEYGAEVEEQSALNLLYLLGYSGPGRVRIFGPSNEKYKVVGGNDRLPALLAESLAAQLRPQHELRAVRKLASGQIRLSFATAGPTIEEDFDHVVFALPFAVLREAVDLGAAGWSPRKLLAIRELGRGSNAKLAVQLSSRTWRAQRCNGETYSDLGYQATWEVTRAQSGTSGILVNYSGGALSDSFAGADPLLRAPQFLQQLEPVLPGASAAWNGRATLDTWKDQPLSRCSYSFFKVGQYTLFGGVEGQPEGNAWFCGEHTSQDAQGYLEGAVETGERAAREVEAAL